MLRIFFGPWKLKHIQYEYTNVSVFYSSTYSQRIDCESHTKRLFPQLLVLRVTRSLMPILAFNRNFPPLFPYTYSSQYFTHYQYIKFYELTYHRYFSWYENIVIYCYLPFLPSAGKILPPPDLFLTMFRMLAAMASINVNLKEEKSDYY